MECPDFYELNAENPRLSAREIAMMSSTCPTCHIPTPTPALVFLHQWMHSKVNRNTAFSNWIAEVMQAYADQQVAAVAAERDEARSGYRALDNNWATVHELFSGAIRGALGMPDATVPELVERIRELKGERDEAQAQNLAWVRWANANNYHHEELNDQTTAGIALLDRMLSEQQWLKRRVEIFDGCCAEMSEHADKIRSHFDTEGRMLGDGKWRRNEILKHLKGIDDVFLRVVKGINEQGSQPIRLGINLDQPTEDKR